jgi:hypothetical protein
LLTETPFLTTDYGKRLKLTAPTRILKEARSENLETAVVVSQYNTREIIRQFEDSNKSEEKLRCKISLRI